MVKGIALNNTEIYKLEIDEALHQLHSSHNGLDAHSVNQRLRQFGLNELSAKKTPLWKRIIEPFSSYFAMVIIAAACLSVYEKKWFEAIIISFILLVNAIIFYVQQFSVSRALNTLRKQDKQEVDVIRDGHTVTIASNKIVPGDIVHVNEGMKIPADGRLIDVAHLQTDEALLTGESLPVHKFASAITETKEVYDQKNMLFKGTYVRTGSGLLLITQTGNNTQLGTINKLASQAGDTKTPIERKIDDLTKKLLIGIICVSVAVFTLAIIRGIHLDEALRFTLSLVVSAVPEGLPVAMTLVLLLSATGMAKQKALIKNLAVMETMGAITLIVTDKTGTITKNVLSVADHFTHRNGKVFQQAVLASLNGNKEHAPDPLDELLLSTFKGSAMPQGWKKVHDFPFDQQLRLSGSVWKTGQHYSLFVKGAPEKIMAHTTHARGLWVALSSFTSRGYRTIGFASKKLTTIPSQFTSKLLAGAQFEGFIGLSDQLRPHIHSAIDEAHKAGIKVVMLTGDHLETARYIGIQTGIIGNASQAVDSTTLASGSDDRIRATLEQANVFGRVLPEHKYALLEAVKGHEITAMTGDGVNDIPALVEADAGLAMGSGADAAKDASDIVLVNSNFSTIMVAVKTGRTVLANIRKMVVYLLGTSGGEVLTMLSALILNIPLPITAIMVLWVNLVTDGVSVIPLGLSQSESHHMHQPPAKPNSPLLDKIQISRAITLSVTMAVTILLIFKYHLPKGLAYAQTTAFLSLIVIQWANALNINYEQRSWLYNFIRPNIKLMLAIAGSVLLNIALFCTPLRRYFNLEALSAIDAVGAILIPLAAAFTTSDMHKILSNYFKKPLHNTR